MGFQVDEDKNIDFLFWLKGIGRKDLRLSQLQHRFLVKGNRQMRFQDDRATNIDLVKGGHQKGSQIELQVNLTQVRIQRIGRSGSQDD